MAMKLKPEIDEKGIHLRLISGSLVGGLQIRQQLALKDMFNQAIHHREIVHKYKPTVGKVKTKPVSKRKEKRKPIASRKSKVRPVLSTNDDERYAMWWAFRTNMTEGEYPSWKGIKVMSIDASAKDKQLALDRSLKSRSSKAKILNYQAVGITPDSQRNRKDLIGSACHPSDQVGYSALVNRNKSYEQELIARYVETSQIARADNLIS